MDFIKSFEQKKALNQVDKERESALRLELSDDDHARVDGLLGKFRGVKNINPEEYKDILKLLEELAYKADKETWEAWKGELYKFEDVDKATAIVLTIENYLTESARKVA